MAATAKKLSFCVNVMMGAALAVDVADKIGGSPPHHNNLRLTVLNATNFVAVGWNGVTAAIQGEDSLHLVPLEARIIPWTTALSLRASADNTVVEIAGA